MNPNLASGGRFWWANPQAHAHTLSGPRRPRRRLLFGAFNPRRRYLTGLGQDDTSIYDQGAITNATDLAQPTQYSAAELAALTAQPSTPDIPMLASGYAPVNLPAGTYGSSGASGTTVSVLPGGSMSVSVKPPSGTSWFSQPGVGGFSNGTVLLGVGAIGLLALMSSRGRR